MDSELLILLLLLSLRIYRKRQEIKASDDDFARFFKDETFCTTWFKYSLELLGQKQTEGRQKNACY